MLIKAYCFLCCYPVNQTNVSLTQKPFLKYLAEIFSEICCALIHFTGSNTALCKC